MATVVARNDMDAPEHWTDAPDYSPGHWRARRPALPPEPAPEPAPEPLPETTGPAPAEPVAVEPAPVESVAAESVTAEPVTAESPVAKPVPADPVPADPVPAVTAREHPPETTPGAEAGPGPEGWDGDAAETVTTDAYAALPGVPVTPAAPARRAARPLFRIGRRGVPGGASDDLRIPLLRSHRIGVIGLSGGAGKTTIALALGAVLARERADRVVAVDASPDSGALGRRVQRQSGAGVRDLVAALPRLRTYMDIRAFTSQTPSGLEVVAHDPDPADARPFGEAEYRQVVGALAGQYPLVLTDAGTGMPHDTLRAVLELSDQLVVAAAPGADGLAGAGLVFDRLAALGHEEKARGAVTVFSGVRTAPGRADEAAAHFRQRCRGVVTVPYDPHLARGGEVDPAWMRGRTRAAYYELAALVARGFPLG